MKSLLSAIAGALLAGVYSGAAQAHDPCYEANDPYYVAASYDPYFELHQIHYQLYLRPFGGYPYPFLVRSPARVVVVSQPIVVGSPVVATPARASLPVRKR